MCILSFFGKQEIYQIFSTGNGDWRSKKITSILVSKTHTDRIQLSYLMTERNYTARNRGCLNFRLDMNLNWSKRAVVCANFLTVSVSGDTRQFFREEFFTSMIWPLKTTRSNLHPQKSSLCSKLGKRNAGSVCSGFARLVWGFHKGSVFFSLLLFIQETEISYYYISDVNDVVRN